jgi:hypothetical protein
MQRTEVRKGEQLGKTETDKVARVRKYFIAHDRTGNDLNGVRCRQAQRSRCIKRHSPFPVATRQFEIAPARIIM